MSLQRGLQRIVFLVLSLLPVVLPRAAEPDPDVARLSQRMQTIDQNPQHNPFAAYERLQARQAIQALQAARRKQRPQALAVAKLRVETAEIAARTEASRGELQRLDIERNELLVEASRRDAEQARAEAERLRVEAQIQAEEAARLREAVEAEVRARQDVEGALESAVSSEEEKLRAAREREAELAKREAELTAAGQAGASNKPVKTPIRKPTSKPKPPVR